MSRCFDIMVQVYSCIMSWSVTNSPGLLGMLVLVGGSHVPGTLLDIVQGWSWSVVHMFQGSSFVVQVSYDIQFYCNYPGINMFGVVLGLS